MSIKLKTFKYLSASALAVAAFGLGPVQAAAPTLEVSEVVDGLDLAWDVAFLSDGTMFITEKCDGLSVRLPSGEIKSSWEWKIAKATPVKRPTCFVTARPG